MRRTGEDVDACSDMARSRAAAAEAGGDAVGNGVHVARLEAARRGVYMCGKGRGGA